VVVKYIRSCRERREQYGASENTCNRRVGFSNRGGAADFVDSRYHFAGRLVSFISKNTGGVFF